MRRCSASRSTPPGQRAERERRLVLERDRVAPDGHLGEHGRRARSSPPARPRAPGSPPPRDGSARRAGAPARAGPAAAPPPSPGARPGAPRRRRAALPPCATSASTSRVAASPGSMPGGLAPVGLGPGPRRALGQGRVAGERVSARRPDGSGGRRDPGGLVEEDQRRLPVVLEPVARRHQPGQRRLLPPARARRRARARAEDRSGERARASPPVPGPVAAVQVTSDGAPSSRASETARLARPPPRVSLTRNAVRRPGARSTRTSWTADGQPAQARRSATGAPVQEDPDRRGGPDREQVAPAARQRRRRRPGTRRRRAPDSPSSESAPSGAGSGRGARRAARRPAPAGRGGRGRARGRRRTGRPASRRSATPFSPRRRAASGKAPRISAMAARTTRAR